MPTGEISGENVVRQTINPATVSHPVDCWVDECVMMAWEGDDVAGTAVFSAPLTFEHIQPDGQIRRLSDSALIGDDVYNAERGGADGCARNHGRARLVVRRSGRERRHARRSISVMVTTEVGRPGIAVRYFAGWFDITSHVTSGHSFTFADVAPGAVRKLVVQFRAPRPHRSRRFRANGSLSTSEAVDDSGRRRRQGRCPCGLIVLTGGGLAV